MTGPAEGDQRRGAVGGGAVVDDERRRGVTDAAGAAVAGEDPFPLAGEAVAVAPAAVVAGLAQPAAVEVRRSAGTAQRELLLMVSGHESAAGFLKRRPALRARGTSGEEAVRRARDCPAILSLIRRIIITKNRAKIKAFLGLDQGQSGPVKPLWRLELGGSLGPPRSRKRLYGALRGSFFWECVRGGMPRR